MILIIMMILIIVCLVRMYVFSNSFLFPILCACAFIFKRNFVLGFNMDLKDQSRLSQVLSSSPVLHEFVPTPTEGIPTSYSPSNSIPKSRRLLKQSSSFDLQNVVKLDVKNESRVLVLYTGGTIGMIRNAQGALVPGMYFDNTYILSLCEKKMSVIINK